MDTISWDDFIRVELRVGRIIHAGELAQARKPAYLRQVDFGPEMGIKNPAPRSPTTTRRKH